MATKQQELVTVQEVADALGVPGQADAVKEGLIVDGITILEDWAGRHAIAFADAKRTIDRHRKQQAEWAERQRREWEQESEARDAQREFDHLVATSIPILQRQNPFYVSNSDFLQLVAAARSHAWSVIKDKYSRDALAKVTIPAGITTIESSDQAAFRPVPIVPPMPDGVAKPDLNTQL